MFLILQHPRKLGAATFILVFVFFFAAGDLFGASKKELRRTEASGAVEFDVVYLNPLSGDGGDILSFEVTMNTHSVPLGSYDIADISFLRFGEGPEQKALGWVKPGGGGHHIFGVLQFQGPAPGGTKSLNLIIKTVGGVAERNFEWKLPLQ